MTAPRFAAVLYFFPGCAGVADVPPAYASRFAQGHSHSGNTLGPTGTRGLLISSRQDELTVYQPAAQRWDPLPGGAWLGVAPSLEPRALARRVQLPGTWVTLDNGAWLVPVANPLVESCQLPAVEVLGPDSQWHREIKPAFLALSERAAALAGEVRRQVLTTGDRTVHLAEDPRTLIADVLALNYDVSLLELSALRVLDPARYPAIIDAFLDLPAMLALLAARMAELQEAGPAATLDPSAAPGASPASAPGA